MADNKERYGKAPRKAYLTVFYKGGTRDDKMLDYVESFQYTDAASGESDSVNIGFYNIDKRWLNEWMPEKGDSIRPMIRTRHWKEQKEVITFHCGTFIIDDISFSGRPLTCTISAVSAPAEGGFKAEEKSRQWQDTTLKKICEKATAEGGLDLVYEADDIKIKKLEQSNETDSSFIKKLCGEYGLGMKIYNNRLVIYSEQNYEKKSPVATIKENDMESWSYNTTLEGTYTGADFSYTNADGKTIKASVGNPGRVYKITSKISAFDQKDAELKAAAALNNANKQTQTMEVTIPANTDIVATSTVRIEGLGKADGKYYVEKAVHNLNAYTMRLKLRKVFEKAVSQDLKASGQATQKYTVVSGDTLQKISQKVYGTSARWKEIYNANQATIEYNARTHGLKSSNNGWWIYPGEVFDIP